MSRTDYLKYTQTFQMVQCICIVIIMHIIFWLIASMRLNQLNFGDAELDNFVTPLCVVSVLLASFYYVYSFLLALIKITFKLILINLQY